MPGRVAAARRDSSSQPGISPSLRPALHPVWLVTYPPNTAPQVKIHTGTLKHTPKGQDARPDPTPARTCPLPRPALLSPRRQPSSRPMSQRPIQITPPGDPVALCWPRPITHTPLTTSCDLHAPATHLLYDSGAERLPSRYLYVVRYQKSTARGSPQTSTSDGEQQQGRRRRQQPGQLIVR